jgi:hypothetical protein
VHECAKSVNFQNIQTYVRKCQRCIFKINPPVLLIAKEVHSTLCDMGYKYNNKITTGYWGLFPWVVWQLGCDVAHPLPSGAEVKNGWSYF